MRTDELEKEAKKALKTFPFLKKMELIDKHRGAIKQRLYVEENFYTQAYYNMITGTTNFVAIIGKDSHDCSSEGRKGVTLTDFLEELQEIIEKENLL